MEQVRKERDNLLQNINKKKIDIEQIEMDIGMIKAEILQFMN
jgi:hypothetical protein